MKRPAPTFQTREALAREIFVAFVSSPLFSQQLNEEAEDDHIHQLGRATAIDAFDLADAFLVVATEQP